MKEVHLFVDMDKLSPRAATKQQKQQQQGKQQQRLGTKQPTQKENAKSNNTNKTNKDEPDPSFSFILRVVKHEWAWSCHPTCLAYFDVKLMRDVMHKEFFR